MPIFARRRPKAVGVAVPDEHANRSWDGPIVVDEPVVAFEPRPPTGSMRPDTICDAWSTEHFTVRAAAVRGYGHRFSGVPRQDELAVRVHRPTQAVVFAVADGVSAATHADRGAELACLAAVSTLTAALDTEPAERLPWPEMLSRAGRWLTREAVRISGAAEPSPDDVERALATTLVAGVVLRTGSGDVARLVQIGDSCGWILRQGRFAPVLRHKTDAASPVVSSAVEPLPRVPVRIRPVEVALPPGGALIVATDGIGDPLGDGTGLVGQLLATTLATPPTALGLARVLDFSRETFDDDRAAVVIWPSAATGGRR
jgi:serine/threonine protein phosphatase PrpC